MAIPSDRKYLASHEWHKLDGDVCTIGITDFAAKELTDVTYVSLPSVGKELTAGKPFGEIESVKATSDLYTGVSGTVIEVNRKLDDAPELVNNDAFGGGWMLKVRVKDRAALDKLLNATDYQNQIGQ